MFVMYEFELFKGEEFYIAAPFDFGGGATQGETLQEVEQNAAYWLKTSLDGYLIHGKSFPEPTYGNKSQHGGTILLIGIETGKEFIRRMSAADAARALGVTRGRVSQLIKAGMLDTFDLNGKTWVTTDSVEARLADPPRIGRPRKNKDGAEQPA